MRIALVIIVLAIAGCASPQTASEPASGEQFAVSCASGKHFTVQYDEGFKAAFVNAGGRTYRLPAVIAASGARYSNGRTEFWEHHGDALFTGATERYDDCRMKDFS